MTDKIPEEEIDEIIKQSTEKVWEPFPGITIVAWQLPSGFVISDQSGCINPDEYDRNLGLKYAREKLKTQVWQYEGYRRKVEFSKRQG